MILKAEVKKSGKDTTTKNNHPKNYRKRPERRSWRAVTGVASHISCSDRQCRQDRRTGTGMAEAVAGEGPFFPLSGV